MSKPSPRRDAGGQVRPDRSGGSDARFDARYRPTGEPTEVDPDSTTGRLVEHHRYFVPGGGAPGLSRAMAGAGRASVELGVLVGEVTRDPWRLAPVDATVRTNTLFAAAGVDPPETATTVECSPRYEPRVGGVRFVP